ncbi:Hypothetical protein HDN1F_37610 [gamma proteobacterium HdN1]|nr:Hypothetical protein HDN1F_37610 [gamma proteobacterium HdN1]
MALDENSSELILTNKATGEKSRIWGDPHFDTTGDGKNMVDFKGTATLNLEDGTKITINTRPDPNNPNVTYASQLTITNGHNAISVNGLDAITKGDLEIQQHQAGAILDLITPDGVSLYENDKGPGWLIRDSYWMREVPLTQDGMNRAEEINNKKPEDPMAGLRRMMLNELAASGTLNEKLVELFEKTAAPQSA